MAGKGGNIKKGASIPPPAKYSVKCELSNNGKHDPQTYEGKDNNGNVVKYKACRVCGGTLK